MTSIEVLLAIAAGEGEVFEQARKMLGTEEMALAIAKATAVMAGMHLAPSKVAEVLDMTIDGARKKIEKIDQEWTSSIKAAVKK
jgi:hypothetical protein